MIKDPQSKSTSLSNPTMNRAPLPPPKKKNKKHRNPPKPLLPPPATKSKPPQNIDIELGSMGGSRESKQNVNTTVAAPVNRASRLKHLRTKTTETAPVLGTTCNPVTNPAKSITGSKGSLLGIAVALHEPTVLPSPPPHRAARPPSRLKEAKLPVVVLLLLTLLIAISISVAVFVWYNATLWKNPGEFSLTLPEDTCCHFHLSPIYVVLYKGTTDMIRTISVDLMYGLLCVLAIVYVISSASLWLQAFRGKKRRCVQKKQLNQANQANQANTPTIQKTRIARWTTIAIHACTLPAILWLIVVPPPSCMYNIQALDSGDSELVCGYTSGGGASSTSTNGTNGTAVVVNRTWNGNSTNHVASLAALTALINTASPDQQIEGYCSATSRNNGSAAVAVPKEACFAVRVLDKTMCRGSKSFFTQSAKNLTNHDINLLFIVIPRFLNQLLSTTPELRHQTLEGGSHYECIAASLQLLCSTIAPPCVQPGFLDHGKKDNATCRPLPSYCPNMCDDVVHSCDMFRNDADKVIDTVYFTGFQDKGSNIHSIFETIYANQEAIYIDEHNLGIDYQFTPFAKEVCWESFVLLVNIVVDSIKNEPHAVVVGHCERYLDVYSGITSTKLECPDNALNELHQERVQSNRICAIGNQSQTEIEESGLICPSVCLAGKHWLSSMFFAVVVCVSFSFIGWCALCVYMVWTFETTMECCWCLERRTTGVFRDQLRRLRWRQIIIFIALVYVVAILCDKARNVLLFPSLIIGSVVSIVIVSMLWASAVLAAFVSVSTLHDVDGLVRYVELSKHSRDLIQNNTGTNEDDDGDDGDDDDDGGDGDGGGEDGDGVNGANNDDDDDASSRSILYRRDTAREKCLNCKRGPRSWYSANFGIRRGRWFFYSKLVFELLEWSLTLATLHSLVTYIPLQYTYAVIAILILNVMISPVLFLCRDRTPVMRELVVVFDTILDLTVIALMSRILVKQVDLEKPVYLLGESFPSIPAVLTGVVWPCFLVLWRCSTLNVGFIRMVVEHKMQQEEDERQQEFKDLRLQGRPNKKRQQKKKKAVARRRSSFLGLNVDRLEKTMLQNQTMRKSTTVLGCVALGTIEKAIAVAVALTMGGLLLHAALVFHQMDLTCGARLGGSSALWWGATPRIVTRRYGVSSWNRTTPYSSNPFVGELDCVWDKIESIVVHHDRRVSLIPEFMSSSLSRIEKIDIRDNDLITLPLSLLFVSDRLQTLLVSGNPLMAMLDLSNSTLPPGGEFPARLCNASKGAETGGRQWDLKYISGLDMRNMSLSSLPFLQTCLPCLRTLYIGDNPLVHRPPPSLLEVWHDVDATARCKHNSTRVASCTATSPLGTSCKSWSSSFVEDNLNVFANNGDRQQNMCTCGPFRLNMESRLVLTKANAEANAEADPNNKKTRKINWSYLAQPLSARCTSSRVWEMASLDDMCDSGFGHQVPPLSSLDFKCAGLDHLNLDVLTLLLPTMTALDLSENALDWESVDTFVDARSGGTISSFWKLFHHLNPALLTSFKMDAVGFDDVFFTLPSIMYMMHAYPNATKDTFSFLGNNVVDLQWNVPTSVPKDNACYSQCYGCCVEESFGVYTCKPTCVRPAEEFRPPLWLIQQLAPTLERFELNLQQYPVSGTNTLRDLCSSTRLMVFRLHNSFVEPTTIPVCLWEHGTLTTFQAWRGFDLPGFKTTGNTREFDFNGQFPASLTNNKQLYIIEVGDLCGYYSCPVNTDPRGVWDSRLNFGGPLPDMPLLLNFLRLSLLKINGTIPRQWCDLASVQDIRFDMLDVEGTFPDCVDRWGSIFQLNFKNNRYFGGRLPWDALYKTMQKSRPGGGLKYFSLENNRFRGPAFPPQGFPSDCSLVRVVLGDLGLNGTIPPSIVNCQSLNALILGASTEHCRYCLGTSITGPIPHAMCDQMCNLQELTITNRINTEHTALQFFEWQSLVNDTSFKKYCTLSRWLSCSAGVDCRALTTETLCNFETGCHWDSGNVFCRKFRTLYNWPYYQGRL